MKLKHRSSQVFEGLIYKILGNILILYGVPLQSSFSFYPWELFLCCAKSLYFLLTSVFVTMMLSVSLNWSLSNKQNTHLIFNSTDNSWDQTTVKSTDGQKIVGLGWSQYKAVYILCIEYLMSSA